jgi:hypothetical protein
LRNHSHFFLHSFRPRPPRPSEDRSATSASGRTACGCSSGGMPCICGLKDGEAAREEEGRWHFRPGPMEERGILRPD